MSNWQKEKEVLLEGLSGKRRNVLDTVLENQRRYLNEQAADGTTGTANITRFDKVVMPLVRRVEPATVAMELVGVQPMNQSIGIVNSLRVRYSSDVGKGGGDVEVKAGEEASGVNVYEKYSLIAQGAAYDSSDALTPWEQTLALESQGGNEMDLEMVKKTVETKTRRLQAKWSLEADQDARSMHGLDIEQEMVAALADQIVREKDRELFNTIAELAGTVEAFDFAHADGRYSGEKFTALSIGISSLSNQIGAKTKRGGASWMVVSPNVLTAMRHANNGSFTPATEGNLSNSLFVGTYNGTIRVYIDLYATSDTILLGYKGNSELDTGLIYSPYIPLMRSDVLTDTQTYNNQVSLMTRYALTSFTDQADSLGTSPDFYARAQVANLQLGFMTPSSEGGGSTEGDD